MKTIPKIADLWPLDPARVGSFVSPPGKECVGKEENGRLLSSRPFAAGGVTSMVTLRQQSGDKTAN